MTNEFFLHPVSATQARRVPFPAELPLADREAYMANPPIEALATSDLVPFVSSPPVSVVSFAVASPPALADDDLTLED